MEEEEVEIDDVKKRNRVKDLLCCCCCQDGKKKTLGQFSNLSLIVLVFSNCRSDFLNGLSLLVYFFLRGNIGKYVTVSWVEQDLVCASLLCIRLDFDPYFLLPELSVNPNKSQ